MLGLDVPNRAPPIKPGPVDLRGAVLYYRVRYPNGLAIGWSRSVSRDVAKSTPRNATMAHV